MAVTGSGPPLKFALVPLQGLEFFNEFLHFALELTLFFFIPFKAVLQLFFEFPDFATCTPEQQFEVVGLVL